MGKKFIAALRQALKENPKSLKELSMKRIKVQLSIGKLTETLQHAQALEYLDISENVFSQYSVTDLCDFIRKAECLEYLNLNSCGLRGQIAEKVMDALMLNTSL